MMLAGLTILRSFCDYIAISAKSFWLDERSLALTLRG